MALRVYSIARSRVALRTLTAVICRLNESDRYSNQYYNEVDVMATKRS